MMKLIVGVAGLIVILAGMRATSTILIPFVLAMFLALVCFPLVRLLQERRVHRVLAVIITMMAVLGALVGPSLLVITAIRQFATAVPGYEAQLRRIVQDGFEWLRVAQIDTAFLTTFADPARIFSLMVNALTGVVTLLSLAFLVALIAAFMLVEAADALNGRRSPLPLQVRQVFAKIAKDMQTWLWVKTIISLATGVAAGFWVGLLGIEFALLWGLTAFLLNYIPNLGSLIAAVPPALLALVQFGPLVAGLVVAGYIVINAFFGSVLEPYLMGRRIGLRPLVVLLSVVLWGWMWGIAGMLLAVPITMAVKFGLESSEESRWIADLLGDSSRQVAPAITATTTPVPKSPLSAGTATQGDVGRV